MRDCGRRRRAVRITSMKILAKVGTHGLAVVEVIKPLPFKATTGDRIVVLYEGRKVPCIIDRVQGGAPKGRPIYFLSRH